MCSRPRRLRGSTRICAQLDHSAANAQVAVVTVQTWTATTRPTTPTSLKTKWKMGRKGSDRGVLVLLAVGDHKYRIEVGYGLEGILPDGKVGDIGREMVPDLRANDYDGASDAGGGRDCPGDRRRRQGDAAGSARAGQRAGRPRPLLNAPGWSSVLQFIWLRSSMASSTCFAFSAALACLAPGAWD